MTLTKADIAPLRAPIIEVWNYIASDLYEAMDACGETLTNYGAIESCIDANRLEMCVQDDDGAAAIYFRTLYQTHGYQSVIKFLAANIQLA